MGGGECGCLRTEKKGEEGIRRSFQYKRKHSSHVSPFPKLEKKMNVSTAEREAKRKKQTFTKHSWCIDLTRASI